MLAGAHESLSQQSFEINIACACSAEEKEKNKDTPPYISETEKIKPNPC
jgi:hypothetical protein